MKAYLTSLIALRMKMPGPIRIIIARFCERYDHNLLIANDTGYSLIVGAVRAKNMRLIKEALAQSGIEQINMILDAAMDADWADPFEFFSVYVPDEYFYIAMDNDQDDILAAIAPDEITDRMLLRCFQKDSINCFRHLYDGRSLDFLFPHIGKWNCPLLARYIFHHRKVDTATFKKFCNKGRLEVIEILINRVGLDTLKQGLREAIKFGRNEIVSLICRSDRLKNPPVFLYYDY